MIKGSTVKVTILVVFFTTLANFFSYLFQVLMGRALEPADYGLLFSLLAIWNILYFIAASFSIVIAKYSAAFLAIGKKERLGSMLKTGTEKSLQAGVGIFFFLLVISPVIGDFIHSPEPLYLPLLFLSSFTLFLLPLFLGTLQGMQRFFGYGLTSALVPFSRLIIALVLVYLGFGIIGGLLGAVISGFVGVVAGFWFLREIKRTGKFDISEFRSYPALVVLSVVFSGILINLDIVLARHFLDAYEAGIYSTVAVFGRIIFYAPAGIAIVLFPKVAEAHERREKTGSKLIKALLAVAVITGSITAVYIAFPVQIVSFLFGESYLPAAEYLALYGIGMFCLSIAGIIRSYLLSKERLEVLASLILTLLIQGVLIALFHDSVQEIVIGVLISNVAGIFFFGILKISQDIHRFLMFTEQRD
jgi:O-antigen/teichoic acid export membrane protein